MINDKKKKIQVIISAVLLGFIIGFLVGIVIGSNKKKPTVYASADVYSSELYLYKVDFPTIQEYLNVNGRSITLYPRSNNVGYLTYSTDYEYPIIMYSRNVDFYSRKTTNYIALGFDDENDLSLELDFQLYDFYIFCNSTIDNFSSQFTFSSNFGLTFSEFIENVIVQVNFDDISFNGFSFMDADFSDIYEAGKRAGLEQGRAEGYQQAMEEESNPLNSPFSFVYYAMNYEILPNFKLFYLFLIGIGAVLFRIIIKAGLI